MGRCPIVGPRRATRLHPRVGAVRGQLAARAGIILELGVFRPAAALEHDSGDYHTVSLKIKGAFENRSAPRIILLYTKRPAPKRRITLQQKKSLRVLLKNVRFLTDRAAPKLYRPPNLYYITLQQMPGALLLNYIQSQKSPAPCISKRPLFLTGVPAKRLYHVGARGHFHKSWEADGGAPVMSTPILAPI